MHHWHNNINNQLVACSWLFILLYQWCTDTQTSNSSMVSDAQSTDIQMLGWQWREEAVAGSGRGRIWRTITAHAWSDWENTWKRVPFARTGALRGTSQEELQVELTWLGARLKDRLLAHGWRRLQVKEATHRCPDAIMWSVVSGEELLKLYYIRH